MLDPYLTKDGTEIPISETAPSYRISVTTIDAINTYLTTDYETHQEQSKAYNEVVRILERKYFESEQMSFGKRCHKILEEAKHINALGQPKDSLTKALIPHYEDGIPEYKATKDYEVFNKTITVVGKADVYRPNRIIDYKITFNDYNLYERFNKSLQWKFYLDIFGCDSFVYKIFLFNQDFLLLNVKSLTLHSFTELHRECTRHMEQAFDFLRHHDLLKYLEAKMK